jgi:hypothetical protein
VKGWIWALLAALLLFGCGQRGADRVHQTVTEQKVRDWSGWPLEREERTGWVAAFYKPAPNGWSETVVFDNCSDEEKLRWKEILTDWKRSDQKIERSEEDSIVNFRAVIGAVIFLSRLAEDEGDFRAACQYAGEAVELSSLGVSGSPTIESAELLDILLTSSERCSELSRNPQVTQIHRIELAQKVGWTSQNLPFEMHNLAAYDFEVAGILHIKESLGQEPDAKSEAAKIGESMRWLEDGSHGGFGFLDAVEMIRNDKSSGNVLEPYINAISEGYGTKVLLDGCLARIGTEWFLREHHRNPISMREINLAMDTNSVDPLGSSYLLVPSKNRLTCTPDEWAEDELSFLRTMRDGVNY